MRRQRLHAGRTLLAGVLAVATSFGSHAAGSATLQVSAAVLSKSQCKFAAGAAPVAAFGTINQASSTNLTAAASLVLSCNGSATTAVYAVSAGNGANFSGGSRQMKEAASSNFLPYTLTLTPTSGSVNKGATTTVSITATMVPSSFSNAPAGAYSDAVSITLSP